MNATAEPQSPRYPLKFSPLEETVADAYLVSTFPADAGRVAAWLHGQPGTRRVEPENACAEGARMFRLPSFKVACDSAM